MEISNNVDISPIEFPNNYKIINELERLILQVQYEGSVKPNQANKFRLMNFNNAVKKISELDFEITSGEQVKIHGIGKGIVSRIDEIISSGTLSEISIDKKQLARMQVVEELTKVPGLGWVKAYDIVKQYWMFGPQSFAEIISDIKAHHINTMPWETQMALKHWNDLQQKIPRSEIDRVKFQLESLSTTENVEFIICGSYRRNKQVSGDIDVLWIVPDDKQKEIKNTLLNIVQELVIKGRLVGHVSGVKSRSYRGYYKVSPEAPARRIDFVIVTESNKIPALVYFTGSANFNRQMRLKALTQGYRLATLGLYDRITDTVVKIFKSEKELFDFLQIEWKESEERN